MTDGDALPQGSQQRDGTAHRTAVYRIQFGITLFLKPGVQLGGDLFYAGEIAVILKVIAGEGGNQQVIILLQKRDDGFKVIPLHDGRMNQQKRFRIFFSKLMNRHGDAPFLFRSSVFALSRAPCQTNLRFRRNTFR